MAAAKAAKTTTMSLWVAAVAVLLRVVPVLSRVSAVAVRRCSVPAAMTRSAVAWLLTVRRR
jgi:hypothetical protein